VAIARVEQADAGAKIARSFLFPTISLGVSASRTREAQNRPNNGNTKGLAATFNDFQLPAFLSYEVDAWGRVRHSIEAANATEQATAADLRFVRLSVEASVAMDYYSLRESDAERQVLDSTVQEMQKAVDLTTNRFRGGLTSELEVKQAQTLLNQTQAQAQALDIQRSQLEHAIAVLEGKAASDFSIPRSPFNGLPPAIPSGLPAELLARRPDIAEVERLVAASNAEIGVAKTAALPHISLTGLAGFESTNTGSLFSWQNGIASLGASALTPLFTGGRVRACQRPGVNGPGEQDAPFRETEKGMNAELHQQMHQLRHMTTAQLKLKYRELFGQASHSNHKHYLWRRVAWHIQALAEGGLSERARQYARAIASDADLRLCGPKKMGTQPAVRVANASRQPDPRVPAPGTQLIKLYKDETLTVTVLEDGYQYRERVYKSLSAIAREVTGTQWNGYLFFSLGLRKEMSHDE
jgi:NodT family efflux transporter outer membrane factor (OMF) lipoprotein